jgi:hypothetical protein
MPEKNHEIVQASLLAEAPPNFVGWYRRIGNTLILFRFPLNNKEHPNL